MCKMANDTEMKRPRIEQPRHTVTFNVGGRHFEVLRYVIQRHPGTLLASLIDDIGTDCSLPIFVDANPERFVHILDWYRYGEMYISRDTPVAAVLRDARYFLLPDSLQINGEMHLLQAPAAANVRRRAKSAVLAEWPDFDGFVTRTISEVTKKLESNGPDSTKAVGETEFWSQGSDATYLYKDFPIASYCAERHRWMWLDDKNVCSHHRLRVLLAELRVLGFECSVEAPPPHNHDYPFAQPAHKWDGALAKLRIGVHLEDNPRGSGPLRVLLDGVHVSHGRLWVNR